MPRQFGGPESVGDRAFRISYLGGDGEDPTGGLERCRIVGDRFERDAEMGHGLGVLPPSRQDQSEIPVRLGEARVHGERLPQDRLGARDVIGGEQHAGEAEAGFDERRIELDRAAVVALRFEAHSDPLLDETEVVVGGGILVVELQGAAEGAFRVFHAPWERRAIPRLAWARGYSGSSSMARR